MKRLLREAFRMNARHLQNVAIIVRPTHDCRQESVESLGQALVSAVSDVMRREVPD